MLVFNSQTANGESKVFQNYGGPVYIQLSGNLDGGSIQPQISQEGLPFQDFGDPFTEQVAKRISFPVGQLKFVLTGATTPALSLSAL